MTTRDELRELLQRVYSEHGVSVDLSAVDAGDEASDERLLGEMRLFESDLAQRGRLRTATFGTEFIKRRVG